MIDARALGSIFEVFAPQANVADQAAVVTEVDIASKTLKTERAFSPRPPPGRRVRIVERARNLFASLESSPEGRDYSFVWDSRSDLGSFGDDDVRLRAVAFDGEQRGVVGPDLSVRSTSSGLRFTQALDVRANDSSKVACADIDRDGDVDLLTIDRFGGQLSYYINDGRGRFPGGPQILSEAGNGTKGAAHLVVADIDGDARPDVVSTRETVATWRLEYRLGGPGSTFSNSNFVGEIETPVALRVVDVDGDRSADIVLADRLGVAVFFGGGDGFGSRRTIVNTSRAADVHAGSIYSLGRADLAMASVDGEILVFENVGGREFELRETLNAGDGPRFLDSADLDGNGLSDLVSADQISQELSVFLQRDGVFLERATVPAAAPAKLRLIDLNGDSSIDAVTSSQAPDGIDVFVGDGTGAFRSGISVSTTSAVRDWELADFDGDGAGDLVTVTDAGLSVFLAERFRFRRRGGEDLTVARGARTTDVDGDGVLDIVGRDRDGRLIWQRGLGEARWSTASPVEVSGEGEEFVDTPFELGDLNGNGVVDLLYVAEDGVRVAAGDGTGSFTRALEVVLTGSGFTQIVASDVNGDSVADVLAVQEVEAGRLQIAVGRGDGSFELQDSSIEDGPLPMSIRVTDINSDGRSDVLSLHALAGNARVFYSRGDGDFDQGPNLAISGDSSRVAVADFNRDGFRDLAITTTSSSLLLYLGIGSGAFGPAESIELSPIRGTSVVALD
ncbi:MAG: VCBS repeat-containing protein, partial [Planctomycetota bacterium]